MRTLNLRLFLALLIAFVLTILPLPEIIAGIRPPWILLFVLYIQFFLPNYYNITLLLFLGLCVDILLSTVIGEHAFALLLTTWFAAGRTRRFNFFSLVQQMVLIAVFCLIYQLIIFLIEAFLGYHNSLWVLACAAMLGMVLWPWLRVLADGGLLIWSSDK
jgi:rod shape-determining protein MreD